MARVVVVGGGFAGLASAARLARLGHDVTLLERAPRLGGALSAVEADGFGWDAGPTWTLLPAVVRDLFRKSGRPVEKELELVPLDLVGEHRFEDGSTLALPSGRAAQIAAMDGLRPGLGDAWAAYVDSYAETWDRLRRDVLEHPPHHATRDRDTERILLGRTMLAGRLRRALPDPRLRLVAAHPFVADGHDPRDVPAWLGMTAYVEQRFGVWTVPGGMAGLADVLARRLETRGVTAHLGTEALDVVVREGQAVAVRTAAGDVDADHVVCAVDPRRLPALTPAADRTTPAIPPVVCHLGLEGDAPDLPPHVVLHGDPLLVIRTGGRAPDGCRAWTVHGRGRLAEDVVVALARRGVDVRPHLRTRVDRSPRDLVEDWGGSPLGVRWQGRGTVRRLLDQATPVRGVHLAGAHVLPGAGLAYVGLSAARATRVIGPA